MCWASLKRRFIEAALEENDVGFLLKVLVDIAHSKGMTQLVRELHLNREGMYRSLSVSGNPSFSTMVQVFDNLGLQLSVKQKESA
jgi:probable addiction module antidote protein